jgi:hypothetical protein
MLLRLLLLLLEGEVVHLIRYGAVLCNAVLRMETSHSGSRHRSNSANALGRKYQHRSYIVVNAEGCSDIGEAPLQLQRSPSLHSNDRFRIRQQDD